MAIFTRYLIMAALLSGWFGNAWAMGAAAVDDIARAQAAVRSRAGRMAGVLRQQPAQPVFSFGRRQPVADLHEPAFMFGGQQPVDTTDDFARMRLMQRPHVAADVPNDLARMRAAPGVANIPELAAGGVLPGRYLRAGEHLANLPEPVYQAAGREGLQVGEPVQPPGRTPLPTPEQNQQFLASIGFDPNDPQLMKDLINLGPVAFGKKHSKKLRDIGPEELERVANDVLGMLPPGVQGRVARLWGKMPAPLKPILVTAALAVATTGVERFVDFLDDLDEEVANIQPSFADWFVDGKRIVVADKNGQQWWLQLGDTGRDLLFIMPGMKLTALQFSKRAGGRIARYIHPNIIMLDDVEIQLKGEDRILVYDADNTIIPPDDPAHTWLQISGWNIDLSPVVEPIAAPTVPPVQDALDIAVPPAEASPVVIVVPQPGQQQPGVSQQFIPTVPAPGPPAYGPQQAPADYWQGSVDSNAATWGSGSDEILPSQLPVREDPWAAYAESMLTY